MPKELFDQQLVDEFSGSDRIAGSIPGAAGGVNMLYENLKAIMRRGAADNWLAQTIEARPSIFQVDDKIYALKSDVVLPFQSATSPDIDTINFALIGRMTDDEIINMINARAGDSRIDASAIKNLNAEAAVGGFASNVYFSALDSDLVGYKRQSSTVDPTETILATSVTAANGDKLVNQYVFDLQANINLIQQGNWSFTFSSFVSSSTGDTRIGFRPFRYTALGVKTYTFTDILWSDELNQLVREYKTANLIQESKVIELTDRLGCDLYIKTSSAAAITVNIVIGDGHALFMNVPIALRHSALRDLNGDSNYVHLTQTEKDKIQLDASGANGNLNPTINTLQKLYDAVDDLYIPVIETIDVETVEEYEPAQAYLGGNTYKSYVNLSSLDPQFQNPAIYRCVYDAGVGQTPESHPYDPVTDSGLWWYLGADPVEISSRSTANGSVRQMSDLQGITGAKSGDTVGVRFETYNNVEIIYMFNALSTATPTQYTVIKPFDVPTASPGRWEFKNVVDLVVKPTVFSLAVGNDNVMCGNNASVYVNAVNGRTSINLTLVNGDGFATDVFLQHQKKWFIILDNSANSSAMSFTFTLPSLHTLEWVGSASVTSIAAGKKARLWITSASKAIVVGAIDTRYLVKYELIGEGSGGGTGTDYENIFFEVAAPDKAYITRAFNWKISSAIEYGGTSTILTSSGTAYTTGATVNDGDYLTVVNTTINARLVAIIQPA